MGKPAARMGDMTAHGGSIVMGFPTVLIGGMPAARVGDMHVCPMVTPGVPPIPHVGGPILPPGGIGVLIGGMPAARMGDMAVCVGPPSTIILGCPTVLIGEVGSGSGGGGGGAGAGAGGGSVSAANAALVSATMADPAREEPDNHFIDFVFEDKAKLPVGGMKYTLTNPDNKLSHGFVGKQIKKTGVPEGSYTVELKAIVDAQWSVKKAEVDEEVDITIDVIGIDAGEKAIIKIYEQSYYGDILRDVLEAQVSGDSITAQWNYTRKEENSEPELVQKTGGPLHLTYCYFRVDVAGCSERSGMLLINDELEILLTNDKGEPVPNEPYRVRLPTGEIRQGTLDSDGKATERQISPGKVQVTFPDSESAKKLPSQKD